MKNEEKPSSTFINRFHSPLCKVLSSDPRGANDVHVDKSTGPLKVNENTTGSGVLRYALHLRFMCPLPKKKSSRTVNGCKSDSFPEPTPNNENTKDERRFYLYNDMRVVFPQRHSDSDEGKVCEINH